MARVEVRQTIAIYEENGKGVPLDIQRNLGVNSHWNRYNFVIIQIGDKSFTVVGNDLITAINNAMNTGEL